uniref:Uncharacterized protein n=1 Tax=Mucochytrium quahogii TaxID=96639 RepID=A0A7S2W2Z1_9STRA|mmetsp:Transcript_11274/g.18420  ORF Transcript_11274/g.18420 Transcript_11274/m.18420 type:complete len:294 (+) Transcript_11274:60-941(+)
MRLLLVCCCVCAVVGWDNSASAIAEVIKVLDSNKEFFDKEMFVVRSYPKGKPRESTMYRYKDFRKALEIMYTIGVGNKRVFMGAQTPLGRVEYKYGLVNIATFLAQSVEESIRFDLCDQVSEDFGNEYFAVSNSCGQYEESYQDMQCVEAERHMQCKVDPMMHVIAMSNAKWKGAPGPLRCGPKTMYPFTGFWNFSADCGECTDYIGQLAGKEDSSKPYANMAGREDIEGCCWWGRGVLRENGICHVGKLNYFLGARAHQEKRMSLYPSIDFCKDPEAVCPRAKMDCRVVCMG